MATHTPAQAIQELVNHTAVLTERLVGLQSEVRKGMNMTPEWGNALTQVVGDTKRMLMAMEHLARLPAFHLDREGLNAAVAAGVQQGLSGEGGASLINLIEVNSRHLDEARSELAEAKKRMDHMLEEMQSARVMSPENRQKFFAQFAPIVGIWSAGLLIAGVLLGKGCSPAPVQQQPVPPAPPAIEQTRQTPAQPQGLVVGSQYKLAQRTPIYGEPNRSNVPRFNGPAGLSVTLREKRGDGWLRISFPSGQGQEATGWLEPGSLQ